MCGIVGIVSKEEFSAKQLISSLKRLEYRGYDSFGFATADGFVEKRVGEIGNYSPEKHIFSNVGIAHTRWSTHGGVTEKNAHPHLSCDGSIFVVHNGIIENYEEMKADLIDLGHIFQSDTDTEVIAHFFEEELKNSDMHNVIKKFFEIAEGTFSVLIMRAGEGKIYALKRDSPLVLGITENEKILASDIYAFSDRTNKAIFFEDNEFAVIDKKGFQFFNSHGIKIEKNVQNFDWKEIASTLNYDHYMLKEIKEQPLVAQELISSLGAEQKEKMDQIIDSIEKHKKIIFLACGTAHHASLIGTSVLESLGKNVKSIIASEFKGPVDENTLVIAISQSGETMDTIYALKEAKRGGAKIISIVNVPYSTIERMADISINIKAGQEVCVAATKSFTNQVLSILFMARELGMNMDTKELLTGMNKVFLQENKIKKIAEKIAEKRDVYILGRALGYPIAREMALKIKEISYIHAEGMVAGELKHGTLALIEDGVPVISIIPENNADMISSTKEVQARGASVIVISNKETSLGDENIIIGVKNIFSFMLCTNIVGQLLTYHIAKLKKLPIDKPRNLAKSVTVK